MVTFILSSSTSNASRSVLTIPYIISIAISKSWDWGTLLPRNFSTSCWRSITSLNLSWNLIASLSSTAPYGFGDDCSHLLLPSAYTLPGSLREAAPAPSISPPASASSASVSSIWWPDVFLAWSVLSTIEPDAVSLKKTVFTSDLVTTAFVYPMFFTKVSADVPSSYVSVFLRSATLSTSPGFLKLAATTSPLLVFLYWDWFTLSR